jgi:hypothetical protein
MRIGEKPVIVSTRRRPALTVFSDYNKFLKFEIPSRLQGKFLRCPPVIFARRLDSIAPAGYDAKRD